MVQDLDFDAFSFKGLVLSTKPFSDSDLYVDFFDKKRGLVSVFCKGARSGKSKKVATQNLDLCNLLEVSLVKRKSRYALNDTSLIHYFSNIREDILLQAFANLMNTLVLDVLRQQDSESYETLYELSLYTLQALDSKKHDPTKVLLSFVFRYLQILGFEPYVDCSVKSGLDIKIDEGAYFSINEGGLLRCSERPAKNYQELIGLSQTIQNPVCFLNSSAILTLRYLKKSKVNTLFSYKLDTKTSKLLLELLLDYTEHRLGKVFKQKAYCFSLLEFVSDFNPFT